MATSAGGVTTGTTAAGCHEPALGTRLSRRSSRSAARLRSETPVDFPRAPDLCRLRLQVLHTAHAAVNQTVVTVARSSPRAQPLEGRGEGEGSGPPPKKKKFFLNGPPQLFT